MVLIRPGWRAAAVPVSLLTGLGTVGLAPAATAHDRDHGGGGARVVATGLDDPRQLSSSGGALCVAEAGRAAPPPASGFPLPVGQASIWRVVPGQKPTIHASGLTNLTDLAFDRHGRLYAVQMAANGRLAGEAARGSVVLVRPGKGKRHTTLLGGLIAPYGIALHHGAAYVTPTRGSATPPGAALTRPTRCVPPRTPAGSLGRTAAYRARQNVGPAITRVSRADGALPARG